MNLSYLVACGLIVTMLSVRIGAKPVSQAQQKVRGTHLHRFPLINSALIFYLDPRFIVEVRRFNTK